MNDLIGRQAAIDAVYESIRQIGYEHNLSVLSIRQAIRDLPSAQPEQPPRGYVEQLRWERDLAIQQLKDLGYGLGEKPRTQPEQRWIPVTERLPEKYIGKWMCCMDDGTIEILPYDTPGDGSKECVFYYWEDDYTVVKPNVVAWMPLPEPYKER